MVKQKVRITDIMDALIFNNTKYIEKYGIMDLSKIKDQLMKGEWKIHTADGSGINYKKKLPAKKQEDKKKLEHQEPIEDKEYDSPEYFKNTKDIQYSFRKYLLSLNAPIKAMKVVYPFRENLYEKFIKGREPPIFNNKNGCRIEPLRLKEFSDKLGINIDESETVLQSLEEIDYVAKDTTLSKKKGSNIIYSIDRLKLEVLLDVLENYNELSRPLGMAFA